MPLYRFVVHGGHHAVDLETVDLPDIAAGRREGTRRAGATLGRIVHGRGIVVDITECKQEGFAAADVFFITEADDRSVSALDRATRHVLAARRALAELDPHDRLDDLQPRPMKAPSPRPASNRYAVRLQIGITVRLRRNA